MKVDSSGIRKLFVEVHVKVTDHHLESRHGLVAILVRKLKHGLLRGPCIGRAQVVVDWHILPCSWWRVIERKVVDVMAGLVWGGVPQRVGDSGWVGRVFATPIPAPSPKRTITGLAQKDTAQTRTNLALVEDIR